MAENGGNIGNNGIGNSNNNGQQSQPPVMNQLLALATQAQGDRPADSNVAQMSTEDRAWLEQALEQISADTDPVKKLKRWIQRLEGIGTVTEATMTDLNDILEEIGDLICDMDLAQVFCALGGLPLIQKFLAQNFEPASALFMHLIAVLAQYNQKVQQLMLKQPFLDQCLATIVDSSKSADYRHKCVGATSAMVKGYLPALIRFIQLDGPDQLMRCFDSSLEADQHPKLVHRCAVAAVALRNSFSTEVLNMNPEYRKLAQWPDKMRAKIEERKAERAGDEPAHEDVEGKEEENGRPKYDETLAFLTY